ncbi:hypothetical protein Tco_0139087 [Tanacetum coccineum]
MLRKKPNKIYDPFLKAGLGYQNPERLKKVIAAQPKMYDGDMLHSDKLKIHSSDSEETLEGAEESQNKMKDKMIQVNYDKINGLYETFVPQQELFAEQTYFSIPSTSNNSSESKDIPSESPVLKMPNEKIDKLVDALSAAKQTHDLLKDELEKSLNDSKEIQANLLHRIKILENDFQRSQAQSIDFELKLQHQKEKMACDVSWKSKLSTLNSKNVLLKGQVESVVQERENIKLEFQKLFNSIKVTRAQHKKEVDELIQCVTQKSYAYGDVRAENQNLLMTISELKNKLCTIEKGKNVNTKFDSSETLGKRVCVTPFNKQITLRITQSTSNKNVITRGVYKINKQDMKTPGSKANTNVSNFTGVESSHSVRRSTTKNIKSKNSILKNTKSSSTYVWKTLNNDCLDSNKSDTKTSNVSQTNIQF